MQSLTTKKAAFIETTYSQAQQDEILMIYWVLGIQMIPGTAAVTPLLT